MSGILNTAAKAATAGILLALIGVSGKFAGYPWLFASLGPAAALQVTAPQLPMSRTWNVAVGHLIAVAVDYAAVFATGAANAPAYATGQELTFVRVEAAALASFWALVWNLYSARRTRLPLRLRCWSCSASCRRVGAQQSRYSAELRSLRFWGRG